MYSIAKPPPAVRPASVELASRRQPQPSAPADRPGLMLGAIVPRGTQTWFFKMTGSTEAVSEQVEPFLRLIQSLKFEEDTPRWNLPEGWTERPGNQFRYATLLIDSETRPMEVSVTVLPTAGGDFNDYLLANVNRWRGQMQVAPLKPEDLETATKKLTFGDVDAWFVMIKSAAAPVSSPDRENATGPPREPQPRSDELPALPFAFDLPAGWARKPAGRMRVAEWEVRDGGKSASISASTAVGDLLANVNRWRGQVKLEPFSDKELTESMKSISVGGTSGQFVELVGPEGAQPRQTILGVVVQAGGRQWFFKLQGDWELAQREKSRFETFVQSIRFQSAPGGNDGQ